MKIRKFKKDETSPYVPNWPRPGVSERARHLKDSKYPPLTFHICSMAWGDKQRMEKKALERFAGSNDLSVSDFRLRDEIFLEYVKDIENLEVDGGDTIVKPGQLLALVEKKDSDSGFDANLDALVDEVVEAIGNRAQLNEGLRKNWNASSDSGTPIADEG